MGNITEFERAVQLVIDNVSFEKPSTVQVFEATIRYHFVFVNFCENGNVSFRVVNS